MALRVRRLRRLLAEFFLDIVSLRRRVLPRNLVVFLFEARRGNPPTPCTCRVADRVSCGGTGHYECTNDWINEHKIIC